MPINSVCRKLKEDLDLECVDIPVRKYNQSAQIINVDDIDTFTITKSGAGDADHSNYNVELTLKPGTQAYCVRGPQAGNNFYGTYDKSRNDLGFPQYIHMAQILVAGIKEKQKSMLEALDKGNFVVALKALDGTVEVFGMEYGLTTQDYSYNISEGGGGTPIILGSLENAPERCLPLIYTPAAGGNAVADYDAGFAQA